MSTILHVINDTLNREVNEIIAYIKDELKDISKYHGKHFDIINKLKAFIKNPSTNNITRANIDNLNKLVTKNNGLSVTISRISDNYTELSYNSFIDMHFSYSDGEKELIYKKFEEIKNKFECDILVNDRIDYELYIQIVTKQMKLKNRLSKYMKKLNESKVMNFKTYLSSKL